MAESTWFVNERGELVERLPPLPEGWRIPDLAHYITGYRAWRVTYRVRGSARIDSLTERVPAMRIQRQKADRLALAPMVVGGKESWPFKMRAVAACNPVGNSPLHIAPHMSCYCGFYAKTTLADAIEYGFSVVRPSVVYGAVALWGRVIVHTEGWRAQYAYPLWLFADERLPQVVLSALADAYGVKVHVGHIQLGVRQMRIYDPILGMEEFIELPETKLRVVATITPQGLRSQS